MATKPSNRKIKKTSKKSKVIKLSFSYTYLIFASIFLGISTIFWSYIGADLHNENSDQLIISYLFNGFDSTNAALLPSAHNFLIKWPLFYLISIFTSPGIGIIFLSILSSLLSVFALAFILFKIEKRPVVLATIYISLASMLLLIPSVPVSGQLIPVNMAMLATRNMEYIIYILCLWLFLKSYSYKSTNFWLASIILAFLISSDKLFLSLSLGGAAIASTLYFLNKKTTKLSGPLIWLSGTILAAAMSSIIIWSINQAGVSNLVTARALGPYEFIHSGKDFIIGTLYSISHLLTNLGANAAFHTSIINDMPRSFIQGLFNQKGLAYIVNLIIACSAIYMTIRLARSHIKTLKRKKSVQDNHISLSFYLICSTVAAILAFVLSNHYYAADARYLGISFFAVVISATVYSRNINWRLTRLAQTGLAIALVAAIAVPAIYNDYQADKLALRPIVQRNNSIIEALSHHKVDVLVGDYWRVVPIKFKSDNQLNILPLEDCTNQRAILSSRNWNVDLSKRSFAYLLSYDDSLTDFPKCSPQEITERYGSPNSSILLSGSFAEPVEQLLIYDNGARKKYPLVSGKSKGTETIRPVKLTELPNQSCPKSEIMNIVAHQDDDLLFFNPDLQLAISSGQCVRSVYITAGDAGGGMYYWLGRQQGTQAAYSKMLGIKTEWADRIVSLGGSNYIVVSNPLGNPNITLIFMYLPDGNLRGQGFAEHKSSLARLNANQISSLETVYTGSKYTYPQLVSALGGLMDYYKPVEIRTHSTKIDPNLMDHSDHLAVGEIVKKSFETYSAMQPAAVLAFYQGYQVKLSPPNVDPKNLLIKEAIFYEYSKYDDGVCRSIDQCRRDPAYGSYLPRQYKSDY